LTPTSRVPTPTKSTSGGATIYSAKGITDIGSWYLLVNADRKSALTQARVDLADGEHLIVRAWPEDATWRREVTDLLERGLPSSSTSSGCRGR